MSGNIEIEIGTPNHELRTLKESLTEFKFFKSNLNCLTMIQALKKYNDSNIKSLDEKYNTFCSCLELKYGDKINPENHYRALKNTFVIVNNHVLIALIGKVKGYEHIKIVSKKFKKNGTTWNVITLNLESGYCIHHKNLKRDSTIDDVAYNLEVIKESEHKKIHGE